VRTVVGIVSCRVGGKKTFRFLAQKREQRNIRSGGLKKVGFEGVWRENRVISYAVRKGQQLGDLAFGRKKKELCMTICL